MSFLITLSPKQVHGINKDLVEVILSPPDVGGQPGKFPRPVDFLVPVLVSPMGIPTDSHLLHRLVLVLLVRRVDLMVSDGLCRGHQLPAAGGDEVLCLEELVAQERRARHEGNELLRRHALPESVQNRAIVDLC